jgi:hypothetical protein
MTALRTVIGNMALALALASHASLARADEAATDLPPADEDSQSPAAPEAAPVREAPTVIVGILPAASVAPDAAPARARKRYVQRGYTIAAGVRNTVVTSEGYDPYSKTDLLAQGSVGVAYAFWRPRPFSLALAAGWDGGVHEAFARGAPASIAAHRLSLGLLTRTPILSRLDGFVRVSGEAIHLRGSIDEPSANAPLVARTWTWGIDALGGASILLATAGGDPAWPAARFWIDLEAGYAFAGEARMAYHPDVDDDDPRLYGSVDLPALRLSGFTTRASLAMSF